ncbi:hypothetical protein BLNAU_17464 [Blattamonas nauphoetae]|uniref:Uncharacterized protein n=1 Tax=Blattamonas nauphoetae TaxID=2049346 RepID=A0ABQ9X767_9EUKA|nr:hypothetical protein BLNAU_17464 [Blattamonas nauphoetae]
MELAGIGRERSERGTDRRVAESERRHGLGEERSEVRRERGYNDDEVDDEVCCSWSDPNEQPLTTIPRRSRKNGILSQTHTPPEKAALPTSPTQLHDDRRTPSSSTTPFTLRPTIKNPLPPTTSTPSSLFPIQLRVHPKKRDPRRSTRHDDTPRPFSSISTKTHPPPNSLLPCSAKATVVEHESNSQFVTFTSPPTVTKRSTLPNDLPEHLLNSVEAISIFPRVFPTTTPPLSNDTPSNEQDESVNRPFSFTHTTLPFPPNLSDDI